MIATSTPSQYPQKHSTVRRGAKSQDGLCLNDGTPKGRDASFSVLAAIAKTTKSSFPRKFAASMLNGKKPVQASGSLVQSIVFSRLTRKAVQLNRVLAGNEREVGSQRLRGQLNMKMLR
ncbi:hypothetical protein GIB67_024333 [Kingdonia uniflora]|uniref:Uncharacterized protein n=1 Tax=Kingdonia uniflora TaxID=39325 RepID=A0A7J7LFC4_9MAGN|nr:hypothetical protein GIB67_024333 [Kingdonia uniflora]